MKRKVFLGFLLAVSVCVFSQDIQEEATVINIEVPVRVFDGKRFVDTLTIDDFEVLEDGKPQEIEAVYFIRKRSVERSTENRRFSPNTGRNFFLFFEISEYSPRIGKGIHHFVHNILAPGDGLAIITPMKSYRLKNVSFEVLSRDEIVKQLIGILRRDTLMGGAEYRAVLDQIKGLAESLASQVSERRAEEFEIEQQLSTLTTPAIEPSSAGEYTSTPLEEQLTLYANYLFKLDALRKVEEMKMMDFARFLREKDGQKYVFMFYQKEFIPQVDPRLLNQFLTLYQDRPNILQTVSDLIDFYRREVPIDVEKIKKTYSDASISIHFLFLTRPQEHRYGVHMEEHSEDIFAAFREMANATGGFMDTSALADDLFERALAASENYYLLYYSPKNYRADGKFRRITIRVKNKHYRVFHRAGYFAN